ncbi:MAG: hypothetical protein U5K74_01985 [Gemmatimonadaceae bacterium]|nr:hypothetical protein [Gemmatimonadaceae bacterium]
MLRVASLRFASERDAARCAEQAQALATKVEAICADAERALEAAVALRQEQMLAWLVLCNRGWPRARRVGGMDIDAARQWLTAWADLAALPTPAVRPQDIIRSHLLIRRLRELEREMRPILPEAVWFVVGTPLTNGRSTLACVLQALVVWLELSDRSAAATRDKERVAVWLSLFTHQARTLGLTVPRAPLDLDGWRSVAQSARALAEAIRRAAAVPGRSIPLCAYRTSETGH